MERRAGITRREFLLASGAAVAVLSVPVASTLNGFGSEPPVEAIAPERAVALRRLRHRRAALAAEPWTGDELELAGRNTADLFAHEFEQEEWS